MSHLRNFWASLRIRNPKLTASTSMSTGSLLLPWEKHLSVWTHYLANHDGWLRILDVASAIHTSISLATSQTHIFAWPNCFFGRRERSPGQTTPTYASNSIQNEMQTQQRLQQRCVPKMQAQQRSMRSNTERKQIIFHLVTARPIHPAHIGTRSRNRQICSTCTDIWNKSFSRNSVCTQRIDA